MPEPVYGLRNKAVAQRVSRAFSHPQPAGANNTEKLAPLADSRMVYLANPKTEITAARQVETTDSDGYSAKRLELGGGEVVIHLRDRDDDPEGINTKARRTAGTSETLTLEVYNKTTETFPANGGETINDPAGTVLIAEDAFGDFYVIPKGESPPLYACLRLPSFTANPEGALDFGSPGNGEPILMTGPVPIKVDPNNPDRYADYGDASASLAENALIRNPLRLPVDRPFIMAKVDGMREPEESENESPKETYTIISADTRERMDFGWDTNIGLRRGDVYKNPNVGRGGQLVVCQETIPPEKLNLATTKTHPFYPLTMNYGAVANYDTGAGAGQSGGVTHPLLWGYNESTKKMDRSGIDYTYNNASASSDHRVGDTEWRYDPNPTLEVSVYGSGDPYQSGAEPAYTVINGHPFGLYYGGFSDYQGSELVPDYRFGDTVTARLEETNQVRRARVISCRMGFRAGITLSFPRDIGNGGISAMPGWEDVTDDEDLNPTNGFVNGRYVFYVYGKQNASGDGRFFDIATGNHQGNLYSTAQGNYLDGIYKHGQINDIEWIAMQYYFYRKRQNYCVRDANGNLF